MHFAEAGILNLLWVVILIVGFLWWAFQNRRKKLYQFVQAQLAPELAASFDMKKVVIKNILLITALVFSVLALARPQWGFEWQEVKREGLDIIVVLDTSRSMLTEDVKPSRLERTKLAVKDLVKKLKGDRIGLVAFAGGAFMVCPLTVDYNGFLLALDDVNTHTIPRGGTDLENAIKTAIKSFDRTLSQYKAIVVITDGESLEGDPLIAAKEARNKGIRIFTVGVGTQEGELIRISSQTEGQYEFLKDDQGNYVKSRLNEGLLQTIAKTADGVYVRASGAQFGLDLIYEDHLAHMERRDIQSKNEKRYHEKFQYPLMVAFLALMLETFLSTRRKT